MQSTRFVTQKILRGLPVVFRKRTPLLSHLRGESRSQPPNAARCSGFSHRNKYRNLPDASLSSFGGKRGTSNINFSPQIMRKSTLGEQPLSPHEVSEDVSELQESRPANQLSSEQMEHIRQELASMRAIGKPVPDTISDPDLEYYVSLTSKSGRKRFLLFLTKKQSIKAKEKQQKLERREELKRDDIDVETLPIPNKILRRISATTMLTHHNWRLASAMKFGPQIVYDFSFDEHMIRPEVISMVSQLTHVLNANKMAAEPFHIHWTGLKEGNLTLKEMKRMFGHTFNNLMINTTPQDVLDMFPLEKLVYLTADSTNIMHTFDRNKIYIVGGLVDARNILTGLTLGKAKRHNINHARFPLDLYLQWELGAKTLTLDQVARILRDVCETQDWTKALKHVPTRKHGGFKMSSPVKGEIVEQIPTRLSLQRYYAHKKEDIVKQRALKESIMSDTKRFSFSRAKREFKWTLLGEESSSGREGRISKRDEAASARFTEDDDEFDPTSDTLFSSSGNLEKRNVNRKSKTRSRWFE